MMIIMMIRMMMIMMMNDDNNDVMRTAKARGASSLNEKCASFSSITLNHQKSSDLRKRLEETT